MTLVLDVVLFGLGVYLAIRGVAACYRVIDLWYTIGSAFPRVIGGLLGWGGAIVVTVTFLGDRQRNVLLGGLVAYLIFYLSLFPLRHLVLRRPRV